jgi:protein O-GlcNAc transferase
MDTKQQAAKQFAQGVEYHRSGRLNEAERCYRQSCTLDPSDADSFHRLGVVAHQLGRHDAIDWLRHAVALKPDFAEAYNDLGVIFGASGKLAEAVACFEHAIVRKPDFSEAFNNLGNALAQLGRPEEALARYDKSLALDPRNSTTHIYIGNVLEAQGKPEEAAEQYQKALALEPRSVLANYNLGAVLIKLGKLKDAVRYLSEAVAIAPKFADAHINLGRILYELKRLDEAIDHCERAVALRPYSAVGHENLANALSAKGRFDKAIVHYQRALALDPKLVATHYNLGLAQRAHNRFADATASFTRALDLDPDCVGAKLALCMSQLPILYASEDEMKRQRAAYEESLISLRGEVEWRRTLDRFADVVGSQQPFYLAYQGQIDRALQTVYGGLVCASMKSRYEPVPLAALPTNGEPIKVGFVSGFFRRHSNWKVPLKGWISQLDRAGFRVFGYHTGVDSDTETDAAAALCDHFVKGPLPLSEWRDKIAADAPHVLIYSEIGIDPISAQLAAQRLAPVQCNTWGHPTTSGFPTLDYFLSSEMMEPESAQEHYTERLVRLPNLSFYCEPTERPPVSVARNALGLNTDAIVYCCFQSPYKYLPQYDEVLPRIARDVGHCQFAFIEFAGAPHVTELFRKRLDRAFSTFGLNGRDYCVFLPRQDPDQFVAAIGQCDVFLDSIGWSGCNTALESLAYNIPIVTLEGNLMRGRHTAAILRMMQIPHTIAGSIDDYVLTAISLGRDAKFRTEIESAIAANKQRIYRDRNCIVGLQDFLRSAVKVPLPTAASPAD